MILLDTNVLSEFMKPVPSTAVVEWLDSIPSHDLWICAITRAEIEVGISMMEVHNLESELPLLIKTELTGPHQLQCWLVMNRGRATS